MKIYLFNPENDIALAYCGRRFNMSAQVSRLHEDGALLPVWYASDGDAVLASGCHREWCDDVPVRFGLSPCVIERCDGYIGVPWGWSSDAARQLSAAGAVALSPDRLDKIAELSHRRVSIKVMSRLSEMLDFPLPPVPVEAFTLAEVERCLGDGAVYVKAPWSSSGRGVFMVDGMDLNVSRRIESVIRKQGSVLVEKALDKKRDFAMLFHAAEGDVRPLGYSLFFNAAGDAYGGNLLAADDEIESMLVADGAARSSLHAIRDAIAIVLSEIIGDAYDGYLGVDMLVAESGMIAPCVEVNMRMTMGVVAHIWCERFLAPESRGIFRVMRGYMPGGCENVVIRDKRLVSGTVSLTPPPPDGGFAFFVTASERLEDGV